MTRMSNEMQSRSVIHIIPADVIGGAEIAAKSFLSNDLEMFSYRRLYLSSDKCEPVSPCDIYGVGRSLNNPCAYISAARWIVANNPDLVVVSLWRSIIVLLLVKTMRPKQRAIVFVHNSKVSHLVEMLLHKLAFRIADHIWVDSEETLTRRCVGIAKTKLKTISFVPALYSTKTRQEFGPNFIYWGRLRAQKNIPRAIEIFSKVRKSYTSATFTIIGPDDGEEVKIKAHVVARGLSDCISFKGPQSISEIQKIAEQASFYLQTSDFEGMAISVVEAMQFGLVPVVTPVGEIKNYCLDGENAIIISRDDVAVERVLEMLADTKKLSMLSRNAQETWRLSQTYRESVIEALEEQFL